MIWHTDEIHLELVADFLNITNQPEQQSTCKQCFLWTGCLPPFSGLKVQLFWWLLIKCFFLAESHWDVLDETEQKVQVTTDTASDWTGLHRVPRMHTQWQHAEWKACWQMWPKKKNRGCSLYTRQVDIDIPWRLFWTPTCGPAMNNPHIIQACCHHCLFGASYLYSDTLMCADGLY